MGMGLGDDETLNFKLGEEQVDRLYLGSAYVWPNVPIADVVATDGLVGLVTVTWSDTNEVAPNTFDLYADDVKVATNVTSPHDYTIDESTKLYSVRGLYGGGHFIGSNEDSGTSLAGIVPGPITDFEASDNQQYQVQCWWSDASGDPVPTYDLYENGGIVAQDVDSGHIQSSAPGTRPWKVVATNAEGDTDSNEDNGTSLEAPVPTPPGEMVWTVPGTYNFQLGWDISTVNICMCGAGGGGDNIGGGGFAGATVGLGPVGVPAGANITIVVGAGGARSPYNAPPGTSYAGGQSSMHDTVAAGGSGGLGAVNGYHGQGSNPTAYCGGGGVDGGADNESGSVWYGGQACFGNGGRSAVDNDLDDPDADGPGAGGGSCSNDVIHGNSGKGGDGYVYISWG